MQVWQYGKLVRTGTIDTATSDSEIVWTASNVNVIDKASGYELRISLEQMILRRQR
ncbi:hypothetical protein M1D88_09660 [Arthrobacter sp. R1-13]